MVPAENRPENRFEVMLAFEKLCSNFYSTILNLSEFWKSKIVDSLVEAKICISTYNRLNVYDDQMFKTRKLYQMKAIEHLSRISINLEFAILENHDLKFPILFQLIDDVTKKILNNQKSDIKRHEKGPDVVKAEFNEAKHRQFFKDEKFDNTKIPENQIKTKDPFDISGLAFNLKTK